MRTEKIKKLKKLYPFLIVLCFGIGLGFIYLGFHNIDLAWNFKDRAIDCNLFGCVSINQLYLRGMGMVMTGMFANLWGSFFSILIIIDSLNKAIESLQ